MLQLMYGLLYVYSFHFCCGMYTILKAEKFALANVSGFVGYTKSFCITKCYICSTFRSVTLKRIGIVFSSPRPNNG